MSVIILAVASDSGVPIFSRKRGNNEHIQFSTIASLHGINMFTKCHNLSMIDTKLDNGRILWKEYCKSVTLIGIATGGLECDLELLLSCVHDLMIFFIGQRELENFKNIEQIKRDLRQCYPMLNYLLESLDPSTASGPLPMLDLMQCTICPQAPQLEVAFRAVTCKLLSDVFVLVVCGATPALPQLEELALRSWEPLAALLHEARLAGPAGLPASVALDSAVLGILVVNISSRECVLPRPPGGRSRVPRLDALLGFYRAAATLLAPETLEPGTDGDEFERCVSETYWCSEYHKCYGCRRGELLCCALFPAAVPTHAARLMTHQILQDLSSNKDMHW
ncbi:protein fuzzy homolog isoform X2 [Amyelois transitella]|uniref:protein fuzzy homolog isoform X2 n=1 Tax=Amyelois transitella TaxID=680683 RepID=UPI00298F537B|nr:protein fuzzy homolog isoform X2 [Amyelois transitella]